MRTSINCEVCGDRLHGMNSLSHWTYCMGCKYNAPLEGEE